jgi:hypothetical protein
LQEIQHYVFNQSYKKLNIIQKEVARNTADGSSAQVGENITTPMVP